MEQKYFSLIKKNNYLNNYKFKKNLDSGSLKTCILFK